VQPYNNTVALLREILLRLCAAEGDKSSADIAVLWYAISEAAAEFELPVSLLAQRLNYSERTVSRALGKLLARGFLIRVRGHGNGQNARYALGLRSPQHAAKVT
jgi:DNA-binding MarR family transcriptional regulator